MFTGLIEAVGWVTGAEPARSGRRLRVRTNLASELTAGDSLAVNGVCLTVIVADDSEVQVDVGPETARVTTLASLHRDQQVNLERPLPANGRVGGHFVQGHVDGTGKVEEIRTEGDAHWLTIAFGAPLAPWMIPKGSIAVDGVSLTVAAINGTRFDAMIVPFTWEHTNLSTLEVGDHVNLECDMIGKYVARVAETALASAKRHEGPATRQSP